jgi:integrase/recombinase XerD
MSKTPEPFTTPKRNDSKTFQVSLSPTSGLPARVYREWQRRSFLDFPDELARYRNPKTKAAARTAANALIQYLAKELEKGAAIKKAASDDMFVGQWVERFTTIGTSPRTGRNAAKNRSYSPGTLDTYKSYYEAQIKDDPLTQLRMSELEEEDITEFINRLSVKKLNTGEIAGGTRTFAGVIVFLRMAFREYQKTHPRWFNPFLNLDPPKVNNGIRDALPEEEVIKLFAPGVLNDVMEVAVCSVMFLSGLRRSEIFALKPEDLDWHTPKITIRRSWQKFNNKSRQIGPTKGKKERLAPFDDILQKAISKLWEENGKHEYVFSFKNGKTPGPSWIRSRFKKWLVRAGIELNGRKIVPHSSRHSLASILEVRGVSLRYIQEFLGHSDLTTTKIYLHSTDKTIRDIGEKIEDAIQQEELPGNVLKFVIN